MSLTNEGQSQPIALAEATEADLPDLLVLLKNVHLPPDGMAEQVGAGIVARHGGKLVGSAILEIYGHAALLRSVAVAPHLQGQRLGHRLTEAALDLAERHRIERVYLLTETAETFFPRFGFVPIARSEVDPAVQQSVEFTGACPASAVAMVKQMDQKA